MTITGVCGDIGAGKSFYQLQYALSECNRKHKKLVCNFSLDLQALKLYAVAADMPYLAWMADNNKIACIPSIQSMTDLFLYPDSVVCLDEAGIFLNAREFSKTPKSLLSDLAQSRKSGIDLIYCSQFDEQVDKQFRMLTQYFIHADGLTKYCKDMRRPKLHWKYFSHFKSSPYWQWVGNHKARSSAIRTMMASFHTEWGPLLPKDRLLFNVFNSFARLDSEIVGIEISNKYIEPNYLRDYQITASAGSLARNVYKWRSMPLHEKLKYPKFSLFCYSRRKHFV